MKKMFLSICFLHILLLVFAQEQLLGKVQNEQKEPLEKAIVKLLSYDAKGKHFETITTQQGDFSFASLSKHAYLLIVEKEGYKTFKQVLTPSSSLAVITLQLDETYLIPIEVRAIRVGDKSPFAFSNINTSDIAKVNQGQNLPYLLNNTPSVVVSSDDGIGIGYSSMRIRGTDVARTNFTINGIPVNDPESQGVFFVNFSDLASSTSSIQIQRGVGSSTNGSGAFGASVNIANLEQGKMPYTSIHNVYGSFNSWKNTILAGTGVLANGFQFDVRLSKITSDGYIQRAASDLKSLQFIAGWKSKNDRTTLKYNLLSGKERTGQAWNGIGVKFTEKESKAFDYSQALDKVGRTTNTLGAMQNGGYYHDQTDNYQQHYHQLFLHHKFARRFTANMALFFTRGKGFYNEYKDEQKYKDYGLENYVKAPGDTVKKIDLIRQLWLDNKYYGSVFSIDYQQNNTLSTLGGNMAHYDAMHYGFIKWARMGVNPDYKWYNLPAFKKDYSVFLKWQQTFAQHLYTFLDMQYRFVDYKIDGFRKKPTIQSGNVYHFFNPKLGASYYIPHANSANSKVYASFAVANKEPNRDDFEVSNSNKPLHETLYDLELGYTYTHSTVKLGANLYYMDYKNQLILTGKINDVGAYTRVNVDKSYRAGIELFFDYAVNSYIHWSGNATFSQNKIASFTQYNDNYDNDMQELETLQNTDIAFSPAVIASSVLSLQPFYKETNKNNFYIDFIGKYVGRQYLNNAQQLSSSIHPYALLDARLRYTMQPTWVKGIDIVLSLNNLLNKKYENNGYTYSYVYKKEKVTESYYYPQAGFNFNLGINIRF